MKNLLKCGLILAAVSKMMSVALAQSDASGELMETHPAPAASQPQPQGKPRQVGKDYQVSKIFEQGKPGPVYESVGRKGEKAWNFYAKSHKWHLDSIAGKKVRRMQLGEKRSASDPAVQKDDCGNLLYQGQFEVTKTRTFFLQQDYLSERDVPTDFPTPPEVQQCLPKPPPKRQKVLIAYVFAPDDGPPLPTIGAPNMSAPVTGGLVYNFSNGGDINVAAYGAAASTSSSSGYGTSTSSGPGGVVGAGGGTSGSSGAAAGGGPSNSGSG